MDINIDELKKRLQYDHTYHDDVMEAVDALSQLQAENANLKLALEDRDVLGQGLNVIDRMKDKEIAELRRELEAQKAECATFRHGHRVASDNCVRLERELEEARKTLEVLAAQSSGIPGSTAKSDCMASLANQALRNMSAARQQQGDNAAKKE